MVLASLRGPKKVLISGPTPSNGPYNGYCPHQNHYRYVPRHINMYSPPPPPPACPQTKPPYLETICRRSDHTVSPRSTQGPYRAESPATEKKWALRIRQLNCWLLIILCTIEVKVLAFIEVRTKVFIPRLRANPKSQSLALPSLLDDKTCQKITLLFR
jgi:hypothetical protein